MLVDKQSELMSDLLFTIHQHGVDDVTWKPPIGTLNNDGSENVAKKMNLRSFNFNRVYLELLNMSNAGDFSWSWILKDFIQVQKEERNFLHKASN